MPLTFLIETEGCCEIAEYISTWQPHFRVSCFSWGSSTSIKVTSPHFTQETNVFPVHFDSLILL